MMIRRWLGIALLSAACTTPGPSNSPATGSADADEPAGGAEAGTETQASSEPAPPPRLLTNPGSGVSMVWNGAATAAVVTERNVVVVEPDLRHLSAVDWRDGEPRWRIELAMSADVTLHSQADRVILHDRDRAIVVEAARGRVLGRHEAPYGGSLAHVRGACAWADSCGIQAVDCEDGRPMGPSWSAPEVQYYYDGFSGDPSEHGTSCEPEPQLLGRSDNVVLMTTALPDSTGRPQPEPSLVALDAASGAQRWHRILPSETAQVGFTEDGGCFILESSPPQVTMVECTDGTARWTRPIGPGTLMARALDETLVVGRNHGNRWRFTAYATADGYPSWDARLGRRHYPVLPRGPIPGAQQTGTRRVYALIEPPRGVIREFVAERDERLWTDPAGGFMLIGRELRELDVGGRLARQRLFDGLHAHSVTATHVLTQKGETIAIYDRELLRERARLEGALNISVDDGLPDNRLLLWRSGEGGVALILGLEAPSRGNGRRQDDAG